MPKTHQTCDQVLIAIRRITRAIDLHSRKLAQSHNLTGPQALVLKEAVNNEMISVGDIAKSITLSQATVTDIVNRLEKRGLLLRLRSTEDKRRVLIKATEQGLDLLKQSPPLLQERFVTRFQQLQQWEQTQLLASLQRIAALMDAEDIDASPVLSSGEMDATVEQLK